MYLISAYFDEHTAKQLQRFINTISEKTGNTYMTDNNVPPQMAKAFEAMQVHFMPLSGEIVRLGLAETNPHKDIVTIELNV